MKPTLPTYGAKDGGPLACFMHKMSMDVVVHHYTELPGSTLCQCCKHSARLRPFKNGGTCLFPLEAGRRHGVGAGL
eukprot:scaffold192837_cov19-Tisochrysis_lutea.AAC.1